MNMKHPIILVKRNTTMGPIWTTYTEHSCTDQQEMQDYCDGVDPSGETLRVVDLDVERPLREIWNRRPIASQLLGFPELPNQLGKED